MAPVLLAPDAAARLLARGGVLLLATDTVPGLHARADRPEAVARIQALKGRDAGKPLLLLAASAAVARQALGPLEPRQEAYLARCWPGPFSLVLPAAPGLSAAVTGGGATVAVRVPRPPALRALLARVGAPLVSTSANRAGGPPAADLAAARALFGEAVDGACDPGDPAPDGTPAPSALVDLTAWPPRLLRPGPEPPPGVDDAPGSLDLPGGES